MIVHCVKQKTINNIQSRQRHVYCCLFWVHKYSLFVSLCVHLHFYFLRWSTIVYVLQCHRHHEKYNLNILLYFNFIVYNVIHTCMSICHKTNNIINTYTHFFLPSFRIYRRTQFCLISVPCPSSENSAIVFSMSARMVLYMYGVCMCINVRVCMRS